MKRTHAIFSFPKRTKAHSFRAFDLRRAFLSLFTLVFIVSGFLSGARPVQAAACATGNDVTISVSCEWAGGTHVYTGTLTINAGITVTADSNGGTPVTVIVDNITLNGTITAAGEGFAGGAGTGSGEDNSVAGGGGHGGNGGLGGAGDNGDGGITYGSVEGPITFGSGGGDDTNDGGQQGGPGGGAVKIFMTGAGTFTFGNGAVISASGSDATGSVDGGGGAGGSIWIDASLGTITAPANGRAVLSANGGTSPAAQGGGGGGGGRIAIHYATLNNAARLAVNAFGGNGGTQTSDQGQRGGAGSVFLKSSTAGSLIVDNGNYTSSYDVPAQTTQSTSSTQMYDDVTIRNGAYYVLPTGHTLSATSTLTGGGTRRPSVTIDDGASFNAPTSTYTFGTLDVIHHGSLGSHAGDLTAATFTSSDYTYGSDTAKFDFTLESDLLRASDLTLDTGEGLLTSAAIDAGAGKGYFVALKSPGVVIKVDLATMTRDAAITLDTGEDLPRAAAIDTANGFLYLATDTAPIKIVKIDLSTFTRVGALTLNSGENYMKRALAIDTTNGFLYAATSVHSESEYFVGADVVKIDLSTFTRVGSITLDSLEWDMGSAVIDEANGFLYLGRSFPGARVVKVDLSSFTRVGSVTISGGGQYNSAAIDTAGGYAYFGSQHYPGASVSRVGLSGFTDEGTIEFEFGENTVNDIAIDAADGYLYAGLNVGPGKVVQVDLDTFTRVDVVTFPTGENSAESIIIDTANDIAYVGTGTTPGDIVKLTGPYAATEGGLSSLTIGSGSNFIQFGAVTLSVPTITVQSGGNMTHDDNSTVDLDHLSLAATTFDLQSGGTINVSFKGYNQNADTSSADGNGPGGGGSGSFAGGGGYGGEGGHDLGTTGDAYGSVTEPVDSGSAGGNDEETTGVAGDGGGAFRLTIAPGGTATINGTITSNGGNATGATDDDGGGSGGSIWIDAVGATVTGSGSISANGGNATSNQGGGGGSGGRIAIHAATNTATGARNAAGGAAGSQSTSTVDDGAAGTIYTKLDSQTYGTLVVDGNNVANANDTIQLNTTETYDSLTIREGAKVRVPGGSTLTVTPAGSCATFIGGGTRQPLIHVAGTFNLPNATCTLDGIDVDHDATVGVVTDLTVRNGQYSVDTLRHQFTAGPGNRLSALTLNSGSRFWTNFTGTFYVGTLAMNSGSVMSHATNTTAHTHSLIVSATTSIAVNSGASVNVNELGYSGGTTSNPGSGPGGGIDGGFAGGAGYGGRGGTGGTPGQEYGSATSPSDIGSGGGGDDASGAGGNGAGAVKLSVNSGGTISIGGTITANGGSTSNNDEGGGSGGSIWINAVGGMVSGAGTLTANGGTTDPVNGGGGGSGGRIAVYAATNTLSTAISAAGGSTGSQSTSTTGDGAAGTIFTKLDSQANGNLTVDNNNIDNGSFTDQVSTSETYDAITIKEGAKYHTPPGFTTTAVTTLLGGGTRNGHLTINGTVNPPSSTFTFDGLDVDHNATLGTVTDMTVRNGYYEFNTITTEFPAGPGNRLSSLTVNSGGKFATDALGTFFVDTATVNSGGVLTHASNTGTTHLHSLIVSATTSVTVNAGGTIDVTQKGFTGGEGPGNGVSGGNVDTGGGAYGGNGGTDATAGGTAYGSVTLPTDLGSGGGDRTSTVGGTGGGAVRITTTGTVTVNGTIDADGGTGLSTANGSGAGGSILIEAGTIAGSAAITADGGTTTTGGGGGGGRVALYYTTDSHSGSVQARPGNSSSGPDGGAGTVFTKQASAPNGDLLIDSNGVFNGFTQTPQVTTASQTYDNVSIRGGAVYAIGGGFTTTAATSLVGGGTRNGSVIINGTLNPPTASWTSDGLDITHNATLGVVTALTLRNGQYGLNTTTALFTAGPGNRLEDLVVDSGGIFHTSTMAAFPLDTLDVNAGGVLTHATNTSVHSHSLIVNATTSAIVDAGGSINVTEKGFTGGDGPGAGVSSGSNIDTGGGAHGGNGASEATAGGTGYDSVTEPVLPGSGGGDRTSSQGGQGGGVIKIAAGGTVTVNGTLSAHGIDGGTTANGGGAGGSIWIDAATTLSGNGTIGANGGTPTTGAGGGGGRVAVYAATNAFTGSLQAYGGTPSVANDGGAGTVFVKLDAAANGDLTVDNNGTTGAQTPQVGTSSQTFDTLVARSGGHYAIPGTFTTTIVDGLTGGGSPNGAITVDGTFDIPYTDFTVDGLDITHNGTVENVTDLTVNDGSYTFYTTGAAFPDAASGDLGDLVVGSSGTFVTTGLDALHVGTVSIENGGVMTHGANGSTFVNRLSVNATSTFTVAAGGRIDTDGKGYTSSEGPGQGGDNSAGGGAGHGGAGGFGQIGLNTSGTGGATYSATTTPDQIGSGGGDDTGASNQQGGTGGGAIVLMVLGAFAMNGDISADGDEGISSQGGGGSGGSVWLTLTTWSGSGTSTITATGGDGSGTGQNAGGCGGGGRIYITYAGKTYTGGTPSVAPGSACPAGGSAAFTQGQEGSFVEDQSGEQPVNGPIVISPTAPEVGQNVIVSATATDETGVASMEIYLDGTAPANLVKTCTFSPAQTPASCTHDLGALSAGAHSVTVITEDEATLTDSDTLNFSVAGRTGENTLDFSRTKVGETAAVTLSFTLSATSTGTLTMTFPSAFTVLSAPTSGSSCLSDFAFSDVTKTMTATKTGCEGTVTMTGGTVQNPSVAGAYTITWTNDNGSAVVYIVDDDSFNISASVAPVITFNVGTQTGTCDGTFSGNGGTLPLGTLTTASVASSDVSSVPHVCTRISTNATGGAVITVRSQNASLQSVSVPADQIPSSTATLVAGTTGYGLCAGSGGSDSGLDVTTPAGSAPVRAAPFNGSCSTSGHAVGALTTSAQTVWSTSDPVQNGFFRLYVKAAVSGGVPNHNDYQDVLTFIATATF